MTARQLKFSDAWQTDRIVNVASVPQRSPFRYPGGKTWFVPYFRAWIGALPYKPALLIEPFAGGAIVGLTAAFEQLAAHTLLVELDRQVASVWQTILGDDAPWLADQITRFGFSPESVHAALDSVPDSLKAQAFQTILKNRINRGGILAQGAGRLRHGEAGKGMASRWYPETLKRRILDIYATRDRLTFVASDGLKVLSQFADQPDAAFFIDPPYTASGKRAGRRLYNCHALDHQALFAIAAQLTGAFVMTYDDTPEIRQLAARHGFEVQTVPMKNTHHTAMTELMIGRHLLEPSASVGRVSG